MNNIPADLKLCILHCLDATSLAETAIVSKEFNILTRTIVSNILKTLFDRYCCYYTLDYLPATNSDIAKLNYLVSRYNKKCIWIMGGYSSKNNFVEVNNILLSLSEDLVEPPLQFSMNGSELFYSRYDPTAAVYKGDIFIAAGNNAYEKDLGTTDRYNLFEKKWNRINQVMKYHLSGQTLVNYRNVLYMIGGFYSEMSVNPDTEYDSEDENMPVYFKSDIYYFRDDNADKLKGEWVNISENEILVEKADTMIRHPLPFGRGLAIGIVYQDNLVLGGGYTDIRCPQANIVTYNGKTNEWDEHLIPPLQEITLLLKFVTIQNELYAIGHVDGNESVGRVGGGIYIEKLHLDHWVVVAENDKCIRRNFAVESYGDVIYVFGGRDDDSSFDDDLSFRSYDAYDVVKKIWLSDIFPHLSARIMGLSNQGEILQSVNSVAIKSMGHNSRVLW